MSFVGACEAKKPAKCLADGLSGQVSPRGAEAILAHLAKAKLPFLPSFKETTIRRKEQGRRYQ